METRSLILCLTTVALMQLSITANAESTNNTRSQEVEHTNTHIGQIFTYTFTDIGSNKEPTEYKRELIRADKDGFLYLVDSSTDIRNKYFVLMNLDQAEIERFELDPTDPRKPGKSIKTFKPMPVYRRPVIENESYSWTIGPVSYDVSVGKLESYDTRFGRVDAIKIKMIGTWQNEGHSGYLHRYYWYAPKFDKWIRYDFQDFSSLHTPYNHFITELVNVSER